MTPPKRWPQNSDDARVESIVQARVILKQIQPLLDAMESREAIPLLELSLRLGRMQDAAHKIITELSVTGPLKFKD